MAALSNEVVTALVILIDDSDAEACKVALMTMAKVVANAADPDKQLLKMSNSGLQKRVLGLKAGQEALIAVGFVPDAEAGTLTWDASLDASAATDRAAGLEQALAVFESVKTAICTVGDSNAPAAAQEALKLCGTYVGNLATQPDDDSRRRIGSANKALNSRLLSAKGGQALLASCGFIAEPEAFVCALEMTLVRIALAALGKAPAIWAELAATRGAGAAGGDAEGSEGGGGKGPKITADAVSTPIEQINLRALASRASILSSKGAADMQPALCKSDDGRYVLLYTWQEASHTWTLQGSMEVPSTEFVWNTPGFLIILVDLGDAHGTGAPVELRANLNAAGDDLENDYVTSRDFIDAHIAESYSNGKEPVINANYLDEIARKMRAAAAPVMTTVRNLKAAMEAQN